MHGQGMHLATRRTGTRALTESTGGGWRCWYKGNGVSGSFAQGKGKATEEARCKEHKGM
jgi:hypothetical protein